MHEASISWRQRKLEESFEARPLDRSMLMAPGLAVYGGLEEYDQEGRVWVPMREQHVAHLPDHELKLFQQLTRYGRPVRLVRLALAARELPEPAMPLVTRALADEVAIIPPNYGSDDTRQRQIGRTTSVVHRYWLRRTLKSWNSLGGSGTSSVQVMFIGRLPLRSSGEAIRTGPQARYGAAF